MQNTLRLEKTVVLVGRHTLPSTHELKPRFVYLYWFLIIRFAMEVLSAFQGLHRNSLDPTWIENFLPHGSDQLCHSPWH